MKGPLAVSDRSCECGCGAFTLIARQTKPEHGHVKGQPFRFKGGHQRRLLMTTHYPVVSVNGRSKELHRLRAERAFGGPLPPGAEVHHVDGTKSKSSALVICESVAYHKLLHIRMRVVRAGGDPNTQRLCTKCGTVKGFADMVRSNAPCGYRPTCKACVNAMQNAARLRRMRARLL